ncbi:MAG: hypothetical protein FJ086_05845 [Deltaproteobacteria bacterium]|nr:hypothetical protein [Deltaproteobacteria bacterium]
MPVSVGSWVVGALLASAAVESPSPAPEAASEAPRSLFLAAELHGSLLSDTPNRSLAAATAGYGLRAGLRGARWGAFLQVEQNAWRGVEVATAWDAGTFNAALGGELRFAEGRCRTALALGTSTLLFRTPLDPPGSTGLFLDLRPVGLRWQLTRGFTLQFDPLTVAAAAPVLGGIPLIQLEYRTLLSVEWDSR